jgi:hypothetical protein
MFPVIASLHGTDGGLKSKGNSGHPCYTHLLICVFVVRLSSSFQDIPFDIHTLCIVSIRRRNSFTAKKFPPLFLYVLHDSVTRNVTVVSAVCDTSWLRCASRWKTESEHLIIRCYTLALALLYKVKRTAFDSSVRQSRVNITSNPVRRGNILVLKIFHVLLHRSVKDSLWWLLMCAREEKTANRSVEKK